MLPKYQNEEIFYLYVKNKKKYNKLMIINKYIDSIKRYLFFLINIYIILYIYIFIIYLLLKM